MNSKDREPRPITIGPVMGVQTFRRPGLYWCRYKVITFPVHPYVEGREGRQTRLAGSGLFSMYVCGLNRFVTPSGALLRLTGTVWVRIGGCTVFRSGFCQTTMSLVYPRPARRARKEVCVRFGCGRSRGLSIEHFPNVVIVG